MMKQEICYTFTDSLITMVTSLVASTILTHRKGATLHEIVEGTKWAYEQVKLRGGKIGCASSPDFKQVTRCLNLIQGTFLKKGHIIEPLHVNGTNFKSFLLLAYYRNSLIHIFLNEAFVASAMLALYKSAVPEDKNGVPISKLWETIEFLQDLFRGEFLVRN